MVFGRRKKEDKDEEFAKEVAIADIEGRSTQAMTQDYIDSLGRSVYMMIDPEVTEILSADEQLKSLIPAFSHLNRTTNIGPKEAELLFLQYEYIDLIHTLNMNEDRYENDGWAKLESLKIFARNIIADAFQGWKGRLLTEQIRIIRTELEKKKRGILG